MKAVLGLLFIFSGLTVGYLVLAGKLPNASATTSTTSTASSTPVSTAITIPGHTIGGPQGVGGGPDSIVGKLPTMAYLNDLVPSRGGMQ